MLSAFLGNAHGIAASVCNPARRERSELRYIVTAAIYCLA